MILNRKLSLISLLFVIALAMPITAQNADFSANDYTRWVDPMIGTGGHGHTFPGATLPNGMVQLSPDTRTDGWDACSGYHHSDSTINGFSHTHLSGTGCADYGDILFMPFTGTPDIRPRKSLAEAVSFASPFSHAKEVARPGYYAVDLTRYGVKAELTATARCGYHRYTFVSTTEPQGLIIDLDYAIQNQRTLDLQIRQVNDSTICGFKRSAYWAPDQVIYFYAVFSAPIAQARFYAQDSLQAGVNMLSGKSAKVALTFKPHGSQTLYAKVGISAVDIDGAKNNLQAELAGMNFDAVALQAKAFWNQKLSKIQVSSADHSCMKIFYTALYHAYIAPNLFSDADGRYRGMDGKIYRSDEKIYTIFSLWDTMRALHPLLTIIDPDLNQSFIRSLLIKYKHGGLLPMWELGANYTATMIGYNAVPVIIDSYVKGYRNFDCDLAYEAIQKSARYDTTGINASPLFKAALVPKSKAYKNELGYIPCDLENESVAKGLEYAYDDWCILQMAKDRKDQANIKKYTALALNYRNYYDPQTGFMRGKDQHGKWRTPFSPRASQHRADDYCEGTAWQWLWFVPHDIEGLASLMGGRQAFLNKLDGLFKADSNLEGETASVDISGLIGQYAHGNEPSHHILHLYNYMGKPSETQRLTTQVLRTLYHADPDGLSGNEDCGQMSAWYLLNAMGLYQICPGKPEYSMTSPYFDRVKIALPANRYLNIEVNGLSDKNCYISSANFNGKPLKRLFLSHKQITQGGTLRIRMTGRPSK